MPSTSRAPSAFAANALLLLTMASWGTSAYVKSYVGCYSSSQPLKSIGTWTYQSSSYCQGKCAGQNLPVLGLSDGNLCWCGSELPAASDKVSDAHCDTPCQGWPAESCGGNTEYFTVWLTGEDSNVPTFGGDSSSSSSSSSSTSTPSSTPTTTSTHPPNVVTTSLSPAKTTILVTQPAQASSTSTATTKSSSGGSTNVAGIAAGAVVGVVAAVAIVTGIVLFLRHRRRKAAEDEYARTNQVAGFMRGGERKPPPTGYSSTSDSRLDPEAGKRNSVGSLADNQDYSRRILRVANPDRS